MEFRIERKEWQCDRVYCGYRSYMIHEITEEVYKLYKRGANVLIDAPPGTGKTTMLIPEIVYHVFKDRMRSIISVPYYSTIEILQQHIPALILPGSQMYCPLRWFPGRCRRCQFKQCLSLLAWQQREYCCPRNVLYDIARSCISHVIKTHSNAFDSERCAYISDEVHIQLIGRPAIVSRGARAYRFAQLTDRELKEKMEEKMELAFKDDPEAIDDVKTIYELLNSVRYVEDDAAYVVRRYPRPRRGDPNIAFTATPYNIVELYYSKPEVIRLVVTENKRPIKVPIYWVTNVDTRSRYFDPVLVRLLLEHISRVHKSPTFFASHRVLQEVSVAIPAYEIWGTHAVGVTLEHDALVVASPWLPPPLYERYPEMKALTAAQLVQVIHRVRPLWRPATIYTLFDPRQLLPDEDYEIHEVVFDGKTIRNA